MAKLSDQYLEARGGWHPDQAKGKSTNSNKPSNINSSKFKNANSQKTQVSSSRPTYNHGQSSQNYKRTSGCYICGKRGHFARDCRQKQTMAFMSEVVDEMVTKRTEMLTTQQHSQQQSQTQQCQCNEKTDVGSCLMVKPDTHLDQASREGFLTLKCGHQLTVLSSAACKDNKCDHVMPVKEGKVGNHRVQVLRDSGCSGVVVKSRLVESKQRTGEVKTCILIDGTVRQFPVVTIEVDTPYFVGTVSALCMDDPVYDLILGNVPGVREPTDPNENWGKSVDIRDIHVSVIDENKDIKHEETNERQQDLGSAVQTRSQRIEEDKPFKKLKVISPITEEVTADMLAKKQQEDPSLEKMRELAKTGEQKISKNEYIVQEFRSPQVEFGDTLRQVVVPSEYRQHVLKIAHESILGGHLGVKKTKDKIMTNFIWPGIQADITRYCQSCDVCQRTIPKGRVTKVPLGSVPLIGVPFQRVAVDLVGPIKPSTERGHRYILVLVDYATRYPEAVPLKTIETEAVAEALLSIYSRLGFPQEVLTDQGSQFVSGVMREVSRLLSIRRLTTTPYHAMANGLVEKFNACLKSMIKKMCEERPRDWDRYIGPLLFAYREAPQDSTGFSPFELLYGRTVRGPMTILKELWTKETEVSETKSVYQYVLDLQDRLEQTCQLAREELMKSKLRYRTYYNKRARVRDMKVGDEVLLLLPTDKNKLLMQWKGPFPIVEKKEHVSDVNISPRLDRRKTERVRRLLEEFEDVLTDIPGKTTLGEHVIKVRDPEPIRSKPYPMPHALRKEMQKEVQTMIRMGVVSLSDSPYACPLVAVAKPDGSRRICFDARRINQVTVFDAEPIPDQEEIFAQLAKDKYFSKIDLSKGYWQIPMAEESKPLTAFVTHDGLYQFNTMPFGLVNAAATFSRVMRKLLRGLDNVHNYIDDILIHTETWESHLQKVREVFKRLRQANLTARPTKCFIGYDEVEFLGHIVGQGVMKPKPDKVEAIQKAEQPTTKKQVRSFLGLAGYYRKFIPNFAAVTAPLTDCTKKGEPNVIRWGENQDRAFHTLKEKLSKSPILQLPDLNKEFTLRTDASEQGVGAILLQILQEKCFLWPMPVRN
ncbi:hypothetical protein BSL78_06637 [Apostichopus japonicus]|uniref:Gag3-Pol3 n=1 Tax=Stichopus japonicus TaxID=307972 RepID=A0A2G8L898_STIJA|nr:hypothetical protein BSL78_06637 [Apostichopus japonicus]